MSRKREAQLLAQERYVAEQLAKWRSTTSQARITPEIEKEVERRIRVAMAAKNKGN